MTADFASRLVLQCPHCGFKSIEARRRERGPLMVQCAACHTAIDKRRACCVFCDYANPGCGRPQKRGDD